MMDFKTLNPKMEQESVAKSASLGLLGYKPGYRRGIVFIT
jgi:hypothetical protein